MRELDSLRKELETWSRAYGVNDASLLTEQWFDDMAAAVSNNEKAAWSAPPRLAEWIRLAPIL